MSTILKALRRLEEERTAPVGRRPLREEVAHRADSPRSRRGAWLLALGGLVGGVAAGVMLLTLWPRDVGVAPSGAPLVRAPARPPRVAAPEPEVAPARLSAEALTSPVEVVERPKPKPLVVDESLPAAEPERSSARQGLAARASAPPVASLPPAAASEPMPALEAWPSTSPGDAAWREPGVDAERLAASPPPMAAGIRVEQTFWHPRPERRVAVLVLPEREQPLRVHEGDALGALVVTEIEPSGVVFTQHGQRVRRALGEAP